MSESDTPDTQPDTAPDPADHAADTASDAATDLPEEWKPEPREWTWKDLFTAPMLAFKPKCMLISVLTFLVIGAFCWLWFEQLQGAAGAGAVPVLGPILHWIGLAVCAVLFGLGATLVSVFMKADLLDDEFLSLKEALCQFKGRLVAAVMVPLFLVGTLAGFSLLVWLGVQICSIPYAGSFLLMLLYPLGFLLALFTVLLMIGVLLSAFVGPAVVSVRKHGWFDNVIDTFEAVGTKPHVLVGNLVLTVIMLTVCYGIGHGAMGLLAGQATSDAVYGGDMQAAEVQAQWMQAHVVPYFDPLVLIDADTWLKRLPNGIAPAEDIGGYHLFTGSVLGVWKILFSALIAGFAVNIFLAGGMLTYLAVREDDYWDDEDLEDLDQLAKELEEEAQREEEQAAAADAAAPSAAAAATSTGDDGAGADAGEENTPHADTGEGGDQGAANDAPSETDKAPDDDGKKHDDGDTNADADDDQKDAADDAQGDGDDKKD